MEATNVVALPVIQSDGPPCLDHTRTKQYDESLGTNKKDMALALGLYCKSQNPDMWETEWRSAVDRYFTDQLSLDDMVAIRDKVNKVKHPRESYPCKALPFCDKSACSTRKYGSVVAERIKLPDRLQLWRDSFFMAHYGEHAIWIDKDKFNPKEWAKQLGGKGHYTSIPTKKEWDTHMVQLFRSIEIIDVPYEETPEGHFYSWFLDWLTGRMIFVEREGDTAYRWSSNPWVDGYGPIESGSPFNNGFFTRPEINGGWTGIKINNKVYFERRKLQYAIDRDSIVRDLGFRFGKLGWFLRSQFGANPENIRRNITKRNGGQRKAILVEIPYTQVIEDNILKEEPKVTELESDF